MSFCNKIVIVTGASSGIGASTAILFAKEGANVVLVGRNKDKLQKITDECFKTGNEPLPITSDLTREEAAKMVVNETVNKFGKIDILVNNAGLIRFCSILDDNIMEVYDLVMNTNLRAPFHMTHLTAPYLIKSKGNIINISSAAGKMTSSMQVTCYAVSKAALDHFTRATATELAHHGVRVNPVSPGPVKTDVSINAGTDDFIDNIKHFVPLKRTSDPNEIAELIMFLASDRAIGITGSDFVSDNGQDPQF